MITMAGWNYQGPLGCDTNLPNVDAGTSCRSESNPPVSVGAEIRAAPVSPLEAKWNRAKDWFSELGEAGQMLTWWMIGSPALGLPNGDLEFGPGDKETEHIRNTAAYQEAVEIYQDWLNNGQPLGKFSIKGTDCEFVPSKGYFFVAGRTGAGRGPRGHWTEPLEHPVWGFTGNFSIRFTESGFPSEGYVNVEIENYTSLPSYLHGIDDHNAFLDSLYTKTSGVPMLSRSRQVYRFNTYIARNSTATKGKGGGVDATHKVVAGDSLSALAKAYYNDMDLWPIIFDRNRDTIGPNADRIEVGQSLLIPAKQNLTPEQIKQAKQTARLWPRRGAV
jgi:LysM repeat protein